MEKKKVLFLGRFPSPIHGASVINENYFNALDKDRNFITKKIKINYSKSLGQVGEVSIKKFFYTLVSYIKLKKELLFFSPDVIYFEIAPRGVAFLRDSIYVLICKFFRKKIVFQFHAKGVKSFIGKNNILKAFYKFIFRKTKVIILSNLLYSDIEDVISKDQIEILPNGIKEEIDEKKFKKIIQKRTRSKTKNLLFLSNMIESKGPLDVLNICSELNQKKVDFECLFVGRFHDNKFEKVFFKRLQELKLKKKCKYLGPKYGKEKFEILEETNYLILPTKYPEECFPVVILEAFMYGIPVLSYDNGAIQEMIAKDFLGYVSIQRKWEELFITLNKRFKKEEEPKKIRGEFKKKYTLKKSKGKLKKLLK